ncbi:hypothetical protein RHGRI_023100 [Rhododendron griersonianum]|uniref:Eukaryotic translation initiation factor 3 subunit M n=1 Tax=Rhododendron griersonianum TaxID=479676 RepID=A0AAV6J2C3_9ERIC|nr:hypothetical protein RHGRI_023100 [Rhododendron griersonianum]
MTTVVPTSEEDPALSVVRFTSEVSWADAGPEVVESQVKRLCIEAQECIVMGRWLELASLMLTSADVIFSKVSDKDLECIFTVICNLVRKPESLDESLEMAQLISTKITQQPNEKPALRLKIMFNLYNLLENPYSRFFVYMKALDLALAANGKITEHIIPSFKKLDNLLGEWNIGIQDQRKLFLTISNILKESKSSGKDSFKFLTKYLATFSGEDAHTIGEAKEEAVHSIVEFVKASDMFQCDLLDMPAVAQLEKDAKYALVYQLLKIFLTQRLDAYLDFHGANSTLLKSYGLVHEDCIAKMRLMSLVDLASVETGQISYALIKDTLRINDDEVEMWVVKAITAKLIDCKMDQMNQVVIVSRCTERVFGKRQWQSLRTKLATWRGNIANVITTIQANKLTEDGTQAMQGLAIR